MGCGKLRPKPWPVGKVQQVDHDPLPNDQKIVVLLEIILRAPYVMRAEPSSGFAGAKNSAAAQRESLDWQ
jgi:hypothetical protein